MKNHLESIKRYVKRHDLVVEFETERLIMFNFGPSQGKHACLITIYTGEDSDIIAIALSHPVEIGPAKETDILHALNRANFTLRNTGFASFITPSPKLITVLSIFIVDKAGLEDDLIEGLMLERYGVWLVLIDTLFHA